ncbi:hypothetical protein A7A08_01943 [Methyloligella halotolerans]|uniref:Uncharacterized protein n=1 Tax=Methyloligella halotolerans TaxID=1177755 RepID=A0A1E2RY76_9HYPH|nr:hypothetical protein [Methyloligella halotolerans]ODA67196.1 hypothetical protein A7A08_01943 [Methyloligella halotolerans]
MDRRGSLLLDAVVMFAMFVTAAAFAAALMVHTSIGTLPAVISGLAILMLMVTSHILMTRFAQGADAERMDDFEAALEIIDGDLQRIDKMEDDVARLDLLTDKIEQFDRTLSNFEAANLSRLSSDMETMQSRLESLRAELETEARSQREELNTELRVLERLMKQLSIDLAASDGSEDGPRIAAEASEEGAVAQDFEPIDFLQTDRSAEAAAVETAELVNAEDEADEDEIEPIDMTAEAEPQRHEAGAWQEDWDETEKLADRDADSWDEDGWEDALEDGAAPGEPAPESATGDASPTVAEATAEEVRAEDAALDEALADEISTSGTLGDERLAPEDTNDTIEDEGEKLAAATAETAAEEAEVAAEEAEVAAEEAEVAAEEAGEPDEPAMIETHEPIVEPGTRLDAELHTAPPVEEADDADAPEGPPHDGPPDEAAPEEADLVEADLERVEAAEIEASDRGVGAPPEETLEPDQRVSQAFEPHKHVEEHEHVEQHEHVEEHEELVLTDLIAEELSNLEEEQDRNGESEEDSDPDDAEDLEETGDPDRRKT